MKVYCRISKVETPPRTIATCDRCEHMTESAGSGPESVRRCLALMREECPQEEGNFYEAEDGSDVGDSQRLGVSFD
jgi:hypothetical protein